MDNLPEFKKFQKIPRLSRDIIITEKIDGTNGVIYIDEQNNIFAGSRNRWLDVHNDNYDFCNWVMQNKEELLKLGQGYRYGEWMGKGINRGYGLDEKRFYLFNVNKWWDRRNGKLKEESKQEYCPECCYVVPILYEGDWIEETASELIYKPDSILIMLSNNGSYVSPGFMKPEGIIIYHKAGKYLFKKTIENDDKRKNE